MTKQQQATIVSLTKKLGLGVRVDQGIKHVLGKMPINMSASRAETVIRALEEEWADHPDNIEDELESWNEDAPMSPMYREYLRQRRAERMGAR